MDDVFIAGVNHELDRLVFGSYDMVSTLFQHYYCIVFEVAGFGGRIS